MEPAGSKRAWVKRKRSESKGKSRRIIIITRPNRIDPTKRSRRAAVVVWQTVSGGEDAVDSRQMQRGRRESVESGPDEEGLYSGDRPEFLPGKE